MSKKLDVLIRYKQTFEEIHESLTKLGVDVASNYGPIAIEHVRELSTLTVEASRKVIASINKEYPNG